MHGRLRPQGQKPNVGEVLGLYLIEPQPPTLAGQRPHRYAHSEKRLSRLEARLGHTHRDVVGLEMP